MRTTLAAPVLDTPRLRLRRFVADDWETYAAICADAQVMRHIGQGGPMSPDDAWRSMASFLGHGALRGYGMWALELRASGAQIGRVGYLDPPGWPGFELGWLLAREQWGRGYAREAASAALRHAFDALRRERVISLMRPANARSIAVAKAIGESLRGTIELSGAEALVFEAVP